MKKTYKQLLSIAVLTATMGTVSFAATVPEALDNATWPETKTIINANSLAGEVDSAAVAIAKTDKEDIDNQNLEFEAKDVPAQYVSGATEAKLAPYVGKQVVSVAVAGVPADKEAKVQSVLTMKVGSTVSKGIIDADIASLGQLGVFSEITPEFTEVPEGVKLVYVVTPNPVVKSVKVVGNSIFDDKQLMSYLNVPTGEVLNTVEVGRKAQGINAAFNRDGYMLAKVSDIAVDDNGELVITINEGIVEHIIVSGNDKTKTKVILREMLQKTNKPLNKFLARRSLQRVFNTGYFADVNMRMLPGSTPDKVVLDIIVVEQKTGTISVGAGYSKSNGLSGMVELGENNLRGTGDKVKVHYEFGGHSDGSNYSVSFTRPWLDDKATSLGVTLYNRNYQYTDYQGNGESFSSYDRTSHGISVSLGRQTGLFSRDYISAETRNDKWETPNKDNIDSYSGYRYDANYVPSATGAIKPILQDNALPKNLEDKKVPGIDFNYGQLQFKDFGYLNKNFGRTNSVTFQHVFDSRDNVYDPRHGNRFTYSLQYAGHGLGGNFDFVKFFTEGRTYFDLGHNHVLALRAAAGYISGHASYNQLFTVGGSNTLRGYEDDQFRGRRFYNATAEYRFPIFKRVQGVLFVDMGSAWDAPDVNWYKDGKRFNIGVGPGIRLQTPIGPVRLDWGFGEEGSKFAFSFGGQF